MTESQPSHATWKRLFQAAVISFKQNKKDQALKQFTEAIAAKDDEYIVYDSRAAVLEQLNRQKDGLKDAKKVIDLAPQRWQGYARSARLFASLGKLRQASVMVDMALERVNPQDSKRLDELRSLQTRLASAAEKASSNSSKDDACFRKDVIHRLPIELLAAIFDFACESSPHEALRLVAVCRYWRDTATAKPSLWKALLVNGKLRLPKNVQKIKNYVAFSLNRISSLTVQNCDNTYLKDLSEHLRAVVDANLRECTVIGVDWHAFRTIIFGNGDSPGYRRLEGVSIQQQKAPSDLRKIFGDDLPLRRLTCRLEVTQAINTLTTLQDSACLCTQLRSLELTNISPLDPYNILHIFQANPDLEEVSVYYVPTRLPTLIISNPELQDVAIDLSRLTCLELGAGFPILEFCEHVNFPGLRILRLLRIPEVDVMLDRLAEDNGTCRLTELSIDCCAIVGGSGKLIKLLTKSPHLRVLALKQVEAVDKIIDKLVPVSRVVAGHDTSSARVLCGSLKTVNFSRSDIRAGTLLRLINNHPEGVEGEGIQRIQEVIVDGCPNIQADMLPALRSKVPILSCVYATKSQASWRR